MSKIFIISNTRFGFKKYYSLNRSIKEFNKYFDTFTSFLKNKTREGDILVHLGNVFDTRQSINTKLIYHSQKIFEEISYILPLYFLVGEGDKITNDVNTLTVFKNMENIHIVEESKNIFDNKVILCGFQKNIQLEKYNCEYLLTANNIFDHTNPIDLNNFKKVYSGYSEKNIFKEHMKNISSPYPLERNNDKKGFMVLDVEKGMDKFIENTVNSKFVFYDINILGDLENIEKEEFNNNFVCLKIDKELIKNKEFQVKMAQYDYHHMEIMGDEKINEENPLEDDDTNTFEIFNIDKMIESKINNDEVKGEFDRIKKIHNKE